MRKPSTFEQRQLLVGRGYNLMDVVQMSSAEAQRLLDATKHLEGSPLRRRERQEEGMGLRA